MYNRVDAKLLVAFLGLNFFVAMSAVAQTSIYDIKGEALRPNSYSEVSGSPYYMDAWTMGIIRFKDDRIVNGVELKYDQLSDLLLFKNSKGETIEITEPISEFKINFPGASGDKLFRSGFKPSGNNTSKSFYEILSDGNIKFIKKTIKNIIEIKEYNSASATKKISTKDFYYVVKADNLPVQVNKNEKNILAAIGDKESELEGYVKANKLNLKNDTDILKLFEYYFEISKSKQ